MIPERGKRNITRLYEPEPFPAQFEGDRKKKKAKHNTEKKTLMLEYRGRWAANLKRYNALDFDKVC